MNRVSRILKSVLSTHRGAGREDFASVEATERRNAGGLEEKFVMVGRIPLAMDSDAS